MELKRTSIFNLHFFLTFLLKQKENVQDIISIWFLLGSVLMPITEATIFSSEADKNE